MKKKVSKTRKVAKKKAVVKKKYKSYYKPKKKAVETPVVKKKYKSYYKPKKKKVVEAVEPPTTDTVDQIIGLFGGEVDVPVVLEQPRVSKRPVKYLNNRDLLAQVIQSKAKLKMSGELAKMLSLLTSRYAKKGNFANYTYNDDMQGYAMLMLVKTWNSFDPAKSSNPFAFFTQCIKNSFIQYLNYEKRQRDIRDEVLVDNGLSPSYNFQYEYSAEALTEPVVENENVDLPSKPSHNIDLFEETEIEEVGSTDANY